MNDDDYNDNDCDDDDDNDDDYYNKNDNDNRNDHYDDNDHLKLCYITQHHYPSQGNSNPESGTLSTNSNENWYFWEETVIKWLRKMHRNFLTKNLGKISWRNG